MKVKLVQCDECQLPAAKIVAGVLVIESKHHGQKHKTVVSLAELIRMATEEETETKETVG